MGKTSLSIRLSAMPLRFVSRVRLRAALGWRFWTLMAELGVATAGSRGKMKVSGPISHPPQPFSISRPTTVSIRSFSSPSSIHFFLVRDRWQWVSAQWWRCSPVAGGEFLRRWWCVFVCCCRDSEVGGFFLSVAFFFLFDGSATSFSSPIGSATSTCRSSSSLMKGPRG